MNNGRIKELRQKHGVSQARLSRLLGVDDKTVNRWEKGHCQPPPYAEIAIRCLLEHKQE
jgi:DNA-binding transcriptional regulator YiaG